MTYPDRVDGRAVVEVASLLSRGLKEPGRASTRANTRNLMGFLDAFKAIPPF
jgi:hypothetical protein